MTNSSVCMYMCTTSRSIFASAVEGGTKVQEWLLSPILKFQSSNVFMDVPVLKCLPSSEHIIWRVWCSPPFFHSSVFRSWFSLQCRTYCVSWASTSNRAEIINICFLFVKGGIVQLMFLKKAYSTKILWSSKDMLFFFRVVCFLFKDALSLLQFLALTISFVPFSFYSFFS